MGTQEAGALRPVCGALRASIERVIPAYAGMTIRG